LAAQATPAANAQPIRQSVMASVWGNNSKLSFEERCQILAKIGFKGVDLPTGRAGADHEEVRAGASDDDRRRHDVPGRPDLARSSTTSSRRHSQPASMRARQSAVRI
jgi:hypothetical protein